MNESPLGNSPSPLSLDIVRTVRGSIDEESMQELEDVVLDWIDKRCKRQINGGNYDATVALSDVYHEEFEPRYVPTGETESLLEELIPFETVLNATPESGTDGTDTAWERIGHLVFQHIIDCLEARNAILYVYDRQRVRTRVAEIARYFALMRQRLDSETPYEFSPNLVKMIKMDVLDREAPKWGADGTKIHHCFQSTYETVKNRDPAAEFDRAFESRSEWTDAVHEGLTLLQKWADTYDFNRLAKYQARSFRRLFLQAVTKDGTNSQSHVITASTGGGKTEAFFLPILGYAIVAHLADIDGARAILGYPRVDLCNNQFQRFIGYIYQLHRELGVEEGCAFEDAPITIGLQHSRSSNAAFECPVDSCEGEVTAREIEEDDDYSKPEFYACDGSLGHEFRFATGRRDKAVDISVTTPDSLHRRLMDGRGRSAFWNREHPPKFIGLDEVHVYSSQYGMHVANVMRRLQQTVRGSDIDQEPVTFASSATISNAEEFTRRIFGTDAAQETRPRRWKNEDTRESELEPKGREYVIFVKSTDPRTVEIPTGDSVFRPPSEWAEDETVETTASNLSCMVQIAFGFYHTIHKEYGDEAKNKILGFVDSIDSVGRLGEYVADAENPSDPDDDSLFELRSPDARLVEDIPRNPDCPKQQFQNGAEDHERAVCDPLPPNKYLNECPVYEAGECWWTMKDDMLEPMEIGIHRSGQSQHPNGDPLTEWDLMVSTSALEVGFDDPSIIGTFQYRAPMSVPSYVQRRGRGGRDPSDTPISVVVLGSSPEDSFYFHNEQQLSNPDDKHLQIPLDENNKFVRMEHLISAVFDYINLKLDTRSADRIYRQLDIEHLRSIIRGHWTDIEAYLKEAFDAPSEVITEALGNLLTYLDTTDEPIAPDIDSTPLWEMMQANVGNDQIQSHKLDPVERALEQLLSEEGTVDGSTPEDIDEMAERYFEEDGEE